LDAAKLLHSGKNRYAIYHCEQAAEKVIKAVLTSEGVHANIRHQLHEMVKDVPDANPLKPLLTQVEHLAAYATTYRYASPTGNIKPGPTTPRSKPILRASRQPSRQLQQPLASI
jgi:HEPN domain-containing protein